MTRLADLCDELNSKEALNKLRKDVIMAYKFLKPLSCSCEWCQKRLKIKKNWHPENINKMNDVWKLDNMIGGFGYPSYDYDSVTWTCKVAIYRGTADYEEVAGHGVNIAQALCHLVIELSKHYKEKK